MARMMQISRANVGPRTHLMKRPRQRDRRVLLRLRAMVMIGRRRLHAGESGRIQIALAVRQSGECMPIVGGEPRALRICHAASSRETCRVHAVLLPDLRYVKKGLPAPPK